MQKIFTVSSEIKIFIVLRSLLAGAFISLLVLFLHFFMLTDSWLPVGIALTIFNLWLLRLTIKKLYQLAHTHLVILDNGFEWSEGTSSRFVSWKDIQKIEMSDTPIGTANTLMVITKEHHYPLHLLENFSQLWKQISGPAGRSAGFEKRIRIWGKEMQLLSATVFCFLLLMMIGSWALGPTDFNLTYFMILIIGLFFILYRPFSQLVSEAITQFEVGLGTICTLAFIFNFTSGVILPYLQKEGPSLTSACGEESPQLRCYSMPQKSCQNMWKQVELSCKEYLKPYLQSRSPSSLVGPAIARCQKQKFDQSLYYTRAHMDTSYCQGYFASIARKPTDL